MASRGTISDDAWRKGAAGVRKEVQRLSFDQLGVEVGAIEGRLVEAEAELRQIRSLNPEVQAALGHRVGLVQRILHPRSAKLAASAKTPSGEQLYSESATEVGIRMGEMRRDAVVDEIQERIRDGRAPSWAMANPTVEPASAAHVSWIARTAQFRLQNGVDPNTPEPYGVAARGVDPAGRQAAARTATPTLD